MGTGIDKMAPMQAKQRLTPTSFPVSVVIEKRMIERGRWSLPQWEAVAVLAGEDVRRGAPQRASLPAEEGRERVLWSGYSLDLYCDSAENYWSNLMAQTPSVFVVCHPDEDEELSPLLVTVSQDEASAHMESDDPVYSVPMPPEIYQWLERYVVENYVPEEKKKRKRKDWKEASGDEHEPRPISRG